MPDLAGCGSVMDHDSLSVRASFMMDLNSGVVSRASHSIQCRYIEELISPPP
jgi:hypothetical protein